MKNTVLITGASTGIGFDGAVALAKSGFRVFAGYRKDEDAQKLSSENSEIIPIKIDVTDTEQIQKAYEEICREEHQCFSLINNAGIVITGPIESIPMNELRMQMDVNFFGLVGVTQTFLPLIRKHKGRVVNISSVSGLASSPFLGAYSASKYAVEAASDSLRWELANAGIKVVIIEPGPIQTPIWDKNFKKPDEIESLIPKEHFSYYQNALLKFSKYAEKLKANAQPVSQVSEALTVALLSKSPPTRILVAGWQTKMQKRMQSCMPQKWVDRTIVRVLFN